MLIVCFVTMTLIDESLPTSGRCGLPLEAMWDYKVADIKNLDAEKRCDLAVTLGTRYGLGEDEIASRLNLSPSMVSKLLYSYKKKNKIPI